MENSEKKRTPNGLNEKDFNFDPWKREKEIDRLNRHKNNTGKERYTKDEFEYINKKKFDSVIYKSFDFEGGYSNNNNDRGGETNYGITRIFMEQYKHALPEKKTKPIKEITKEDAYRLYNAMWNNKRLGYIRDKELAFVLNDYMINSGEWSVARRVQEILNSKGEQLKTDGIIGTRTLEAIHRADKDWLIDRILADRYKNYRELVKANPSQEEFFVGWINRLNNVAEKAGSTLRFPTEPDSDITAMVKTTSQSKIVS